ncbi:MAG TPA: glycoside hydrolase family 97 N-terminal domain-containing protein [Bacteroidales bacterium]|nr:glycoside hydrolase family 97 N-terminal domain-containing protein [Bacteroidales bacterium]
MVKRTVLFLFLGLCVNIFCLSSQNLSVKSPDGKVTFNLSAKNGSLHFNAMKNGVNVIENSPVGFSVDGQELSIDSKLGASETYKVDEQYATRGIHSQAINKANGITVKITGGKNKMIYTLEARAYNDGVAFRLILPGKDGEMRIPDEETTFNIPAGSILWYHDMYAHYEGIHEKREISEVTDGEWAAPPITIKLPGNIGYASITESALKNYAGMSLQANGKNGLVTRLGHAQPAGYPFAHDYSLEAAIRLSAPAPVSGTIMTPWRTVIIASDLNELVNTDLISNLAPAPDKTLFPDGVNTDWIKPGRSVWCWLDGGDRTLEGMKEFSRLAGELGFEYNTVDAFWSRWTDEQIKELVDYSAQFGVKIWLWRHGRDVSDPQARKELFDRCQRLGVVGLKLDAFSHESKEFIDLYQACLKEAAEHHLMLNIHGSNKPTGEVRTWPNEMTREAIRGLENGKNQYTWATHNTTLPFTRFVAGAGDYTPMVFGERRLETTWTHQIATALIFNSSVIFYGSHPKTMLENPGLNIIKDIPATWDETIVLPFSEIGEVAAYAHRHGDTWFLAVLNGTKERALQIPLKFLNDGWYEASVMNDSPADAASLKIQRDFCRKIDSFTARMRSGGGFVVKFTPRK